MIYKKTVKLAERQKIFHYINKEVKVNFLNDSSSILIIDAFSGSNFITKTRHIYFHSFILFNCLITIANNESCQWISHQSNIIIMFQRFFPGLSNPSLNNIIILSKYQVVIFTSYSVSFGKRPC